VREPIGRAKVLVGQVAGKPVSQMAHLRVRDGINVLP